MGRLGKCDKSPNGEHYYVNDRKYTKGHSVIIVQKCKWCGDEQES